LANQTVTAVYGSGAWIALRRHPVDSRQEVGAQDELASETACLEAAVRLDNFIERNPLGDPRPNGAIC